jgi:shikimate kinase
MRKIVLIGYMGVGKTTVAQILAEKLNVECIDLDKLIEEEAQLTIDEIFKQKGELYFRKVEHNLFKKLLQEEKELILSTGGGTPCYANNHLLLNEKEVVSFYLNASVDLLYERLKDDKKERPLVAQQTEEELKEFIAKHLFDRSYFYNQATYKISVDGKNAIEVASEIMRCLA